MTSVDLPALRSDDPLGFLAALGVIETLVSVRGLEARLGWRGVGGGAHLVVDLADADAVANALVGVAVELHGRGHVVPADGSLIVRRFSPAERKARKAQGIDEKNDPMRGGPAVIRDRLLGVQALERNGDEQTARWAAALLNMLAVDRDGMALLTPLYAPVGQQVLSQLLAHYLGWAIMEGVLREALVAWRRRDDGGANLDHRTLRDGAWSSRGAAENVTIPGATWLALMSIPLFRQVGDGRFGESVGWQRDRRAVRPRRLVWPIWTEPRSLAAIEVLLSHPDVVSAARAPAEHRQGGKSRARSVSSLEALGVTAVCSARRVPLGNADGPLQATEILWS